MTEHYEVGDFVAERLYTDTKVWEVVAVSKSGTTLTLRDTRRTGERELDRACDHSADGAYGVYRHFVESDEHGREVTVRRRKHGGFAVGREGGSISKLNGRAAERVDWRY